MAAMAILALVAVMASLVLLPSPAPLKLKTSVGQVAALFNQARELAVSRNTTVYVLINGDQNDPERYLRHAVVTYHEFDEETDQMLQVPFGNGVHLPEGIRFVPNSSYTLRWNPGTRERNPRDGPSWFAFHIGSAGGSSGMLMLTNSSDGSIDALAIDPIHLDGFLLRRNGYLTFFRGADHIAAWQKEQMDEQR